MQSNARAIVLPWSNCTNRPGMIISDLHEGFEGAAVNARGYSAVAGVGDPGSRMPIHVIDLKFIHDQIVRIANDDAICCRIKIDNVTRAWRTPGQPLALPDRKQLDPVMFTNEVSIDVVNFAAMKFIFTQMRAQKRLVIVTGNKTNFLAVNLDGEIQA